jgi:protocatechuate 3,4-dioxygenase, alpha subunit
MVQPLGYLKESASQTAGPYVHIGLTPNFSGIAGVYESASPSPGGCLTAPARH